MFFSYKTILFDIKMHDEMYVKFMFSKKATKINDIFTIDLTLCSKCQIDCEDVVNFSGLLRKYELYLKNLSHKLTKSFCLGFL